MFQFSVAQAKLCASINQTVKHTRSESAGVPARAILIRTTASDEKPIRESASSGMAVARDRFVSLPSSDGTSSVSTPRLLRL